MAIRTIQKRSDPAVFRLRNIRDGRDRSFVFCEGEKLIQDLFGSSWRPMELFCLQKSHALAKKLVDKAGKTALPITILTDQVMEYCSDLSTPPGLIALAKPPKFETPPATAAKAPLVLVIHGVQLPQNAGALLRTGEGAGVTQVITTPNTADLFGPKSLRGSSGSAFRLSVESNVLFPAVIEKLRAQKIRSVAASQNGKISYDHFDWTQPAALFVGSEGSGFSDEEMEQMDDTVVIPMLGGVESLNVANAAAICLFEAARQRRAGTGKKLGR